MDSGRGLFGAGAVFNIVFTPNECASFNASWLISSGNSNWTTNTLQFLIASLALL